MDDLAHLEALTGISRSVLQASSSVHGVLVPSSRQTDHSLRLDWLRADLCTRLDAANFNNNVAELKHTTSPAAR